MRKTQSEWRKAAGEWLKRHYVERPKGKAASSGPSSSMKQRLQEHLQREGFA